MRKLAATIRSADLNKACFEAKKKGWTRAHVTGKTDTKGRLIALGYYFEEEVITGLSPPIKWLQPDRCEVVGTVPPNSEIEFELAVVGKNDLDKQRSPMTKRRSYRTTT